MEAADALCEAMDHLKHITILIPDSSICDLKRRWELRKKFIEKLISTDRDKVHVFVRYPFGPNEPHSYVHSKTWIFDDQFAMIGSPNYNLRGWTHDSEICVGIFDESTNKIPSYTLAHRLRIRLWAEHLGMDTPEGHALLANGVGSLVYWYDHGKNVKPYDKDGGTDSKIESEYPLSVIDPNGR